MPVTAKPFSLGGVINPIAPTRNIEAFSNLVAKLAARAPDTPGIGCFYGPAGLGKSKSAVYGANRARAWYVECSMFSTARSVIQSVLAEMGIPEQKGAVTRLLDMACERMAMDPGRPLIIDEAHWIAHKKFVDLVRVLHDLSRAPVILIGEEMLPRALELHERVHSRVLDWAEALPTDAADLVHLARVHAPGLEIAPDLVAVLLNRTHGNARRIVVQLADMRLAADLADRKRLDLASYDASLIRAHKAPLGRRRAA